MATRKPGEPTEHAIQASFFDWVRTNENRSHLPGLRLLHAIPNGAAVARVKLPNGKWSKGSNQANKLKAEGLRKGILDTHLPVRGYAGYSENIGLWIEFKRPGEFMSSDQEIVAALLREHGAIVVVCDNPEDAIDWVERYLAVEPGLRTQHFR